MNCFFISQQKYGPKNKTFTNCDFTLKVNKNYQHFFGERRIYNFLEKMKISQQKCALIFNILVNSSLSSLSTNSDQKII